MMHFVTSCWVSHRILFTCEKGQTGAAEHEEKSGKGFLSGARLLIQIANPLKLQLQIVIQME